MQSQRKEVHLTASIQKLIELKLADMSPTMVLLIWLENLSRDFQLLNNKLYPILRVRTLKWKVLIHPKMPLKFKRRSAVFLLFFQMNVLPKIVDIVKALRLKAAPILHSVMAAVTRGAVLWHERNLLVANGGHLSCFHDEARRIIYKVTKDEKNWLVV